MNETYAMKAYEQTFSVTPEQRAQAAAAAAAALPPPPPKPASVVSQPAFWAIVLAGFLWYNNK